MRRRDRPAPRPEARGPTAPTPISHDAPAAMVTYAPGPNPQLGGAGRDGLPRGLGGSLWAQNSLQIGALSRQARRIVLQLAFEKYLRSQSLCGSLEQCTDRVNDLAVPSCQAFHPNAS